MRKQKREEQAKRTLVVILRVSTFVNEIKWFEKTRLQESLLLSELLME